MVADELGFIHRFEAGEGPDRPPLLLLHGTGGSEDDLVPFARSAAPGAALLSPRGRVREGEMARFFRRLAEGVFDHEDVRRRAHELADFVLAAGREYGLTRPIALGYSNGANIAAALLYLRPEVLAGAVLLRAMVPLEDPPAERLHDRPVLLLSGKSDPIIAADNAARLARTLVEAGAPVRHEVLAAGHGLTQDDFALTRAWLAEVGPNGPGDGHAA
ncbi:MAG: alpha/beta hydrolase [Halofilum sp. (in: g-proteobacteria)]|nr:alpha/beta hydrolase [Halofilum sp. (in: g-proteobacteria)]